MRPVVFILGLMCASCVDGVWVRPVAADLIVSPEAVVFEDTVVGTLREQVVDLQNRSRRSLELEVEAPGPFIIEAPRVLAAGERVQARVRFVPTSADDSRVVATVRFAGVERQVHLRGKGVLPPACTSDNVCAASTFDPTRGACAETHLADGTACSSACLVGAACVSGTCVGSAVSCDDGRACTLDACDPNSGCVSIDTCVDAATPCTTSTCGADGQCASELLADGTACGPRACENEWRCLSGACRQVAAPRLSQCAFTCDGLKEVWSHAFTAEHFVWYAGAVDEQQNTYAVECTGCLSDGGTEDSYLCTGHRGEPECEHCAGNLTRSCSLLSLTRTGAVRFRTPLQAYDVSPTVECGIQTPHRMAVVDGEVVTSVATAHLDAVSTSSGLRTWKIPSHCGPTILRISEGPDAGVMISRVASTYDDDGHTLALCGGGSCAPIAPDPSSAISGLANGSDLLVQWVEKSHPWSGHLRRDAADGGTMWAVPGEGVLSAVVGDELFLAGSGLEMRSAHTGVTKWRVPTRDMRFRGFDQDYPWRGRPYGTLVGDELVVLVDTAPLDGGEALVLRAIDRKTGVERWRREVGTGNGSLALEPMLISGERVLFAPPADDGGAVVTVVGPDGVTMAECPLPTNDEVAFRVGVLDEAIVVLTRDPKLRSSVMTTWTLRAFSAPSVTLDPAHWAIEGATPRRNFRLE